MRIKYNILWIENEERWLDTAKKFVSRLLDDHGFEFNPKHLKTKEEIDQLLETDPTLKKYDLILVDFQLDKGERGDLIIQDIRDHKIYTEVIFYSQDQPGIKKILDDKFIDGVYISHRDGAQFREKVEKVFLSTVKKAQDISAIRGLVISETSILDDKIYSIISQFFSKFPNEEQTTVRSYIFEDLVGNLEEKGKALQTALYTLPNETLLLNGFFDAYKKARILGRIIQLLNNNELISKKDFNKRYIEEIIDVRNELAHCIEQENENGSCLVTKKGDKSFDDDACKLIRKNIREHLSHLEKIESHIQKMAFI